MRVRIFDDAKRDLLDGHDFYEYQSKGLGNYFFDCLSSDIRSLRVNAGIYRRDGEHYCLRSKRFHHTVYYKIENETAQVFAVVDCRRDPDWIAKRLS